VKGYRRSNRDANHGPIVAALKRCGRTVYELDGCKDEEPGIPDVLAVWPGGFCFIEIKSDKGKLNPAQVAWHAAYRGPRGSLVVARDEREALRATGVPA
jgi:hypothetical protein